MKQCAANPWLPYILFHIQWRLRVVMWYMSRSIARRSYAMHCIVTCHAMSSSLPSPVVFKAFVQYRVAVYSSSTSRWRPRTLRLNSSALVSHSSAASPLRGEALQKVSKIVLSVFHGTSQGKSTYLLGSPSKLCRLSSTVWVL